MDSSLLRVLLEVYDARSISKAARKINQSQPAISKSLRRLEDIVGEKLFERTPQGLIPTIYGDVIARHAEIIQHDMHRAKREIEQLSRGGSGHYSFGVSPGFAHSIVPDAIAHIREMNPNMRLTVIEGLPENLMELVDRGSLDFAICTATVEKLSDGLIIENILKDPIRIISSNSHPLASRSNIGLSELLQSHWVLTPYTTVVRGWFNSKFISEGMHPPVPIYETTSVIHIRRLLESGKFLTLAPIVQWPEIQSGEFVTLHDDVFTLMRQVGLIYRRQVGLSQGGREIVNLIRDLSKRALGD